MQQVVLRWVGARTTEVLNIILVMKLTFQMEEEYLQSALVARPDVHSALLRHRTDLQTGPER